MSGMALDRCEGLTHDGDKLARVGVEVVVWSQTGKDKALLESSAGESLVDGNAPT